MTRPFLTEKEEGFVVQRWLKPAIMISIFEKFELKVFSCLNVCFQPLH